MRQCPSCGGFCKKSGCERANVSKDEMQPVAYIGTNGGLYWMPNQQVLHSKPVPLYMAPPQPTPLTDEQIFEAWKSVNAVAWTEVREFARAIEAAHNIKGEA